MKIKNYLFFCMGILSGACVPSDLPTIETGQWFLLDANKSIFRFSAELLPIDSIKIKGIEGFSYHFAKGPSGSFYVNLPSVDMQANGVHSHSSHAGFSGYVAKVDYPSARVLSKQKVKAVGHNLLYVSDSQEVWMAEDNPAGTLRVFDESLGAEIFSSSMGENPTKMAQHVSGKIGLCLSHSTFLKIVDSKTKEIEHSVKVNNFPSQVYAGEHFYVTNEAAKTIDVVSAAGKGLFSVQLDGSPGFVLPLPKSLVAVCMSGLHEIYVYQTSPTNWQLVKRITVPEDPHKMVHINNSLYVLCSKSAKLAVVNMADFQVENIVDIPKNCNDLIYNK